MLICVGSPITLLGSWWILINAAFSCIYAIFFSLPNTPFKVLDFYSGKDVCLRRFQPMRLSDVLFHSSP